MSASLVGSEMCIRDRCTPAVVPLAGGPPCPVSGPPFTGCRRGCRAALGQLYVVTALPAAALSAATGRPRWALGRYRVSSSVAAWSAPSSLRYAAPPAWPARPASWP
eukprot:9594566-Alexandrium_andersonii.AAC.1